MLITLINPNMIYAARLTTTIHAPVGSERRNDTRIPTKKHITDNIAEQITTLLNVVQTLMAVSAGKIMRLEISIDPIIRIPTTIVNAVSIARSILHPETLIPDDFAKLSSNVEQNILL